MSNCNIPRSILQRRQFLNNLSNIQSYRAVRTVTTVSASKIYEDPALANAKPFEEMPGLPILPFVGTSWQYFPIIGRYNVKQNHIADKHKFDIYGPVIREKFGKLDFVSSYEPDTMKLFYEHEGQYPCRGELSSLKIYRESRKQWYKSTGVIILQGKEWYDLRSKTQKHIMKPKVIHAYFNPIQDVARDMVSLMRVKRDANKEVPDFLKDLYKWSLESIAYVGLDSRLNCLNPDSVPNSDGAKMINSVQTMFDCMNRLEGLTGNFPFWKYFRTPTWKKYEKDSDIFTEISFKYINRSLENLKSRKDDDDADLTLLHSMLMTKDLDLAGVMVTVADMIFGGIDTTSHSVGYLLYNLARNPDKQEKLFKEIQVLLPRKEDRITPDIFNKLHYLKACMKESHRLLPVVRGVARVLDHDVVVSGYRVPAGTAIFCVLPHISKQEKYFKNASKFIPERWLDKAKNDINPFAYVPFGVGIRSCIGRRVAELEISSLTIEIIRNFNVEYHHADFDIITRLINIPDKPLRFKFLDR